MDLTLTERVTGRWRRQVCGGLAGDVLEVGFGSGRNLRHYGPEVIRVHAVEPSDVAWSRASEHVTTFARPVHRIGLDGAELSLPDQSVDAVVSTWTMCTIPDLEAALSEMKRVLRPGGSLCFVEHSAAPTARVARVQHALQPVWGSLAGGCHLNRDIPAAITGAGFTFTRLEESYLSRSAPARPFSWFVTGAAASP